MIIYKEIKFRREYKEILEISCNKNNKIILTNLRKKLEKEFTMKTVK
jgi:hypothetical protein